MKKLLILFFICFAEIVYSQYGILDNSFDSDGIVTTDVASDWDIGYDMVIQPDGKIIIAGLITSSGEYDMGAARYLPDGSLDTTFSDDGIVSIDFDTANQFEQAFAIELQQNGKILLAGHSEIAGDNGFAIARLNPDGSLDSSFDNDGMKVMQIGAPGYDDMARDILIDQAGNIILVGEMQTTSWSKDFALAKLHTDGSIDTTFGYHGVSNVNFFGLDDIAYAGVILADGRIAVAGSAVVYSSTDYALAVLTPNGFLDHNFSGNGKLNTDFGAGNDFAYDIKQQGDGKLVLAGSSVVFSNLDMTAARYYLNGIIDSSFSFDGKLFTHFNTSENDEANCILIQPDNYIVLGGYIMTGGNKDLALIRTDFNGIEDSTFGVNSLVITDILGDIYEEVLALAIQPDLKIVAGGTTGSSDLDFVLTRYTAGLNIGLEELGSIQSAMIYPNPVEKKFLLQFNLIRTENISIDLITSDGKHVKSFIKNIEHHVGEYQLEFDLPGNLVKGIYFIVLSTGSNSMVIKILH